MVFLRRQSDIDSGDRQTRGGVDEDIREELEFHLYALRRDIERDGGADPDEVVEEVRRRFGDSERYERACRRIARKEVMMMQKINYMIMGVLAAIVLLLGVRAVVSYQREVELRREADMQRAEAEQMMHFMTEMMTEADPEPRAIDVRELLDEAAKSIEVQFAEHPEIEAKLREAIREAREAIDQEGAAGGGSDDADGSGD